MQPLRPEWFESVLTPAQYAGFQATVVEAQLLLAGVTVWNVNSTAQGGGVAEMLRSLIGYALGAGLDVRWLVIPGRPEFFKTTKRIHNYLHGSPGDGGALDAEARRVYEQTLAPSGDELAERVRPGDVVLLHDPQTAGLAPAMRRAGAHVAWRCHVGVDDPNEYVRTAWRFLLPDVTQAEAVVFSRASFVWEGIEPERVWIVPPSIDAFAAKNRDLAPTEVADIMAASGLFESDGVSAGFRRHDGTWAPIGHRASVVEVAPLPMDTRLVAQVSRWDRLKDPLGVMTGFAEHVAGRCDAHLVLAGPATEGVADDPEGAEVLKECVAAWSRLPDATRARVHLASLPMEDVEENAAIVNALQRSAVVGVQKSLAEGFGLTVAEAMWKARPVVASRVGAIQDQVTHGVTGLLLDDPHDLATFGDLLVQLLSDPPEAAAMGQRARVDIRDRFLTPRQLMQDARLLAALLGTQ